MSEDFHAFRDVPKTGVIYVTSEATKLGFSTTDPEWCNLGQGQPETGDLPGAPPRIHEVTIAADDQEYAPVAGLWELREAVAALYNRLYRKGHAVAVHRGERLRSPAAVAPRSRARRRASGASTSGTSSPTTPRTRSCSTSSRRSRRIPILLEGERGYASRRTICGARSSGRGLSALLLSNPCNPTGKLVARRGARALGAASRASSTARCCSTSSTRTTSTAAAPATLPVESAARYVEDVDKDPVVHLRRPHQELALPGLARHVDASGRRRVIERFASAGSFLDGGGSKPLQRAAIPLFDEDYVVKETMAIQTAFREKRDRMLSRLERIGVRFDRVPDGTFYAWGNVANLPAPLNDGMGFFRAALDEEGHRRAGRVLRREPGQAPPRAARRASATTCASPSGRRSRTSSARSRASRSSSARRRLRRRRRAGSSPGTSSEPNPCCRHRRDPGLAHLGREELAVSEGEGAAGRS